MNVRYIGSKSALLEQIEQVIDEHGSGEEQVFCDIFSGTGVVARYFKPRYTILSNDLLHFSYVIQKATVENNGVPAFDTLAAQGITNPLTYLEEAKLPESVEHYFIAKHYAPNDQCQRMYLTRDNALRVDYIRLTIEDWRQKGWISDHEYYYLLAALVEGVPYVSNITGTYGAYLKHWDKRAHKPLELVRLEVGDNGRANHSYNCDALALLEEIQGDILYIDPPYNTRQYAPNYHLLETISRYDYPKISGITGMRPYQGEKSRFCIRGEAIKALEELVSKAQFTHLILSYSTEGIMAAGEIEQVLKRHGLPETFKRYDIPYRKYKSKVPSHQDGLKEYIFYIQKAQPEPPRRAAKTPKAAKRPAASADKKRYLKSPLNYIGGKYKLLPQILPYFPKDIRQMVDLFCGGCNVAINVPAQSVLCNDINSKIIELFQALKNLDQTAVLTQIQARIDEYGLSKENEQGFKDFRTYYNQTGDPIDLYTLSCYSFNYQFRFNNHLEYNNPFGRNRSHFSPQMRDHLIHFMERIQQMDITFRCGDFTKVALNGLGPDDLIYCDPPYYITTGSYNDGNRGFKDWQEPQERALYDYLDEAHRQGIPFALSNVLSHKGQDNEILRKWSRQYTVIDLNYSYANSSYNTSKGQSREVLVVNYR